jgi:DNA sulfur modification protein DndD
MLINSITLNNYRLYKGINRISFSFDDKKNIFLIAGENGFGKTTFLTSLIWCMYGRQMSDVENTFKKDFSSSKGYAAYLISNLNKSQRDYIESLDLGVDIIRRINNVGYTPEIEHLKQYTQYSVSIVFSDLFIPSVPCESVTITRKYDIITETEIVEILINGKINELCTEIGPEVFINDFILNKDIARFFFFDSEKIVSLAEINTVHEKRKLSTAYNEVLGVKKYEDLKKNLENLRIRLRKKSSDIDGRNKLIALMEQQIVLNSLLSEIENKIKMLDDEIVSLKKQDDEFQLKMFREGNSMTLEDLKNQQSLLDAVQKKDIELKAKLKELFDYVPFAIAGKAFLVAKKQADKDVSTLLSFRNFNIQNDLLKEVYIKLVEQLNQIEFLEDQKDIVSITIERTFNLYYNNNVSDLNSDVLLDITKEQYAELQAIFENVRNTFKSEFQRLTDDYRKNRQVLERTSRKISNARSNENDLLIKSIRKSKNEIEELLKRKEQEVRSLYEKSGSSTKELNTLNRKISELSKIVSIDDKDASKDALTERLISELDKFLTTLKTEKKHSLERRIKLTMNGLMHKEDFVSDVRVQINGDLIEIELIDSTGAIINKESLSKGEQQLYATTLLKSLVDESEIKFPVFIDSPLQKFDKVHSKNIITEFYPNVSKQVVLFPLLFKELTKDEYGYMLPNVKDVFFIKNGGDHSFFENIEPTKLFQN